MNSILSNLSANNSQPLFLMDARKNQNKVIFDNAPSTEITTKLTMDISKELSQSVQPKVLPDDFSYKASSSLVSQRFSEKDFSVFMPPSALGVYKN